MTFNNSITYCASQSINSYLADIDSKAEFDFIQNYMSTQAPNNSIWVFKDCLIEVLTNYYKINRLD